MGFETIPGSSTQYGLINFDADGRERRESNGLMSDAIVDRAKNTPVTDVFVFCHGWKGDVPAAKEQYNSWIGALVASTDRARADSVFPGFNPLFVGLHWPSEPWGDEELGGTSFTAVAGAAGDALLRKYLERLGDKPEIRAPLEVIFNEARTNVAPDTLPPHVRQAYLDLDQALGLGSDGVDAPPDADREGFDPDVSFEAADGASFGGLNLGGLLAPLRQLSYWTMKKRARRIGEGGMHDFLNRLQRETRDRHVRIHLMGHSFGTIVISGMLGGPDARGTLERPVDSVVLVQGAVSLWCYAPTIPFAGAGAGYFARVLADGKVSGPVVTTQSKHDTAVGVLYPLASRVSGSASFGNFPEFGAIGTFGMQGLDKAIYTDQPMNAAHQSYQFGKGRVYNLNGSQFIAKGDGASGAHSDIAGPEVAHTIWEAAFASA